MTPDPFPGRCRSCCSPMLEDLAYCGPSCETAHAERVLRRRLFWLTLLAHLRVRFARFRSKPRG